MKISIRLPLDSKPVFVLIGDAPLRDPTSHVREGEHLVKLMGKSLSSNRTRGVGRSSKKKRGDVQRRTARIPTAPAQQSLVTRG